jgi:malonyl-CoA O-methyltransferase
METSSTAKLTNIFSSAAHNQINLITNNFSNNALHYDQFASAQKFAAEHLDNLIANNSNQISPQRILEIGCGTGLLSQHLVNRFPNSIIEFLDPAKNMIATCKETLYKNDLYESIPNNHFFIENTIESYLNEKEFADKEYSLIVSSFTLHWLSDFSTILNKLIDRLQIGGQIIFSLPTNKSFPEWKAICQDLNLGFTGNQLPNVTQLNALTARRQINMELNEYSISSSFSTALEFFQEIKYLGAATTINFNLPKANLTNRRLSIKDFRQIVRTWNQKSQCSEDTYNRGVRCTYWLVEGIITRHS